ncbi:MAG: A/G-specific adenine glycosylase [Candidatus Marinimicrobia bacterium]|nr:A/G-specific adenine glycosylase [Candidatus Neomarinimicrobiota bacterium]MCF7904002.1 A/G-specific adenine glycosylase [Candidatus Neomarinimicrobiota bacterium]
MPDSRFPVQKLLAWFDQERASIPVPGRNDKDPYAIWIAEIMLQQTQVATVWPYYEKWMAKYPDVASLAQADQDDVLKHWEGLGYYSRARNLHAAARLVMNELGGSLPNSFDSWLKLPGIGEYTAASIASLAFGEPVALIDGNVLRVYSRLKMITADISKTKTKRLILKELQSIISRDRPGVFNQALMDLGRVVCTPKRPRCQECPLASACAARKYARMEAFPVRAGKKPIPHYDIVIGLIEKEGRFLVQKRPDKGLLGGLWEFPGGKIEAGESHQDALLREIVEETSLQVEVGDKIATIKHAYTHFKITMTAYWCRWISGDAQTHAATENQWVSSSQFKQLAFPKANLKILQQLKR